MTTTTQLDTENLNQFGGLLGTATQQQNAAQGAMNDLDSLTTAGINGPAAGQASLDQANAARNGNGAAGGAGGCGGNNAATQNQNAAATTATA